MKRNPMMLLLPVLLTSSIFGTALEIPELNLEIIDPEIEITIPDTNIKSFSLIPEKELNETQLDEIWNGMERAKFERDYDKNPQNFKIYRPEPFSALTVVPKDYIDEEMIHQPTKEFDYNMPILKSEFQLEPSQIEKQNKSEQGKRPVCDLL